MAKAPGPVRYFYRKNPWSERAVFHAFAYLSAVSGRRFIEDKSCADLWFSENETPPKTARLKFNSGEGDVSRVFIRTASEWEALGGHDPIAEIISRLSMSFILGPHSNRENPPPPTNEPTLSVLIGELARLLARAGIITNESRFINLWPAQKKFALALTHDIDIARRTIRGSVRLLFHRRPQGGVHGLYDSAAATLGGMPNPYDAVGRWIEAEKKPGIKSTFFVFAGNRKHVNDPKYKLEDLSGALRLIRENGHELGLHSGIESYRGEFIEDDKARLEKYSGVKVTGIRPHYLSASFPEYWAATRAKGFSYSSSVGFDDKIGFIGGLDLPYLPFDTKSDRDLSLPEFPITVMDCGLIGNDEASSPEVFKRGERLFESAAQSGGLIVLDWHQRTFYNPDYPGWADLCLRLINRARELGAHLTTLGETAAELKKRFEGTV